MKYSASFNSGRPAPHPPRPPVRTLAEFAREVGVSSGTMTAFMANAVRFPDSDNPRPQKTTLSGKTPQYVHAELRRWWENRK